MVSQSELPNLFVDTASHRVAQLFKFARGGRACAVPEFAERLREEDLEGFPLAELAEAEEHNATLLETERASASWQASFARAARSCGADRECLELLCRQRFILFHGKRITQLRQLLTMIRDQPFVVATDLPRAIVLRIKAETRWGGNRMQVPAASSAFLRVCAFVAGLVHLGALHAAAAIRIAQLARLPRRELPAEPYAAWIGADAAAVSDIGPRAFSLQEFLAESLGADSVRGIVLQGARAPAALTPGLIYRRSRFALRWRPAWHAIARALASQLVMFLGDLVNAWDWRRRELIGPVTVTLPGVRLWFESDKPRAVLYANSMIGAEPPVALVGGQYDVTSMMVFYSANVAHLIKPSVAAARGDLEPEIRCIAADRIAMWSEEMRSAFVAAGYPRDRLPVTGVVHFGRQAGFAPTSRFVTGKTSGAIRLGLFDVSLAHASRRFMAGYGQTFYHPRSRDRFFLDLIGSAQDRWGDEFVLVRKLKREIDPYVHSEDIDLRALLSEHRIINPAPSTSLWCVLQQVDLVVCMPFTSVAYMAAHYGIPAAYYDPFGTVQRSSLAGRAPLLSGRQALAAWLGRPDSGSGYDPSVIVAQQTLKAACGSPWLEPQRAGRGLGANHA